MFKRWLQLMIMIPRTSCVTWILYNKFMRQTPLNKLAFPHSPHLLPNVKCYPPSLFSSIIKACWLSGTINVAKVTSVLPPPRFAKQNFYPIRPPYKCASQGARRLGRAWINLCSAKEAGTPNKIITCPIRTQTHCIKYVGYKDGHDNWKNNCGLFLSLK